MAGLRILDQPTEAETLDLNQRSGSEQGIDPDTPPAGDPTRLAASPGADPRTDVLLHTRLFAPRLRPGFVRRPRLQVLMDEAAAFPLTLISAPAGFGKSTLLADWAFGRMKEEGGRMKVGADSPPIHPSSLILHPFRVAWLSLDASLDDPIRFFRYAIAAVDGILPGACVAAGLMLRSTRPAPLLDVAASLLNDLAAAQAEIWLVLDDYQFISAPPIHEAVTFLVENLPPTVHLLIASRTDPPLPLPRWRGRACLAEIRAADLRFTPSEAAQFLNDSMGLRLSEDDVAALDDRTEGWIAGLQLAALSLRDRPDRGGFVRTFSGSHRFILDYLVQEVLSREPPEVQTFLLRTSVLDRFTASLCDALLAKDEGGAPSGTRGARMKDEVRTASGLDSWQGQAAHSFILPPSSFPGGSQAVLDYLDRSNLFVVPLDDDRQWYRYHHLFADLLRTRLAHVAPAWVRELHARASDWYAASGFVEEAISHALAAEDPERAADLIERAAWPLVCRGDYLLLQRWIGALPADYARDRPVLSTCQAWAFTATGPLDTVEPLLDSAEERLATEPDVPPVRALRCQAAVLRSLVADMQEDLDRAFEQAALAARLFPPSDPVLASWVTSRLADAYHTQGAIDQAYQTWMEARRMALDAGNLSHAADAVIELARLRQLQGQLRAAAGGYQELTRVATEMYGGNRELLGIAQIGLGDLRREANELTAASQQIAEGLEQVRGASGPAIYIWGHAVLAQALLSQGELLAAEQALEQSETWLRGNRYYCRGRALVRARWAALFLARGDLSKAGKWAEETGAALAAGLSFVHEIEHIMLVRIWLRQGELDRALALCERLERAADAGGRHGRSIEIRLLHALALHRRGQPAAALLGAVLARTQPEGYVRLFLDEGQPMADLLGAYRRWAGGDPLSEYAGFLLSCFARPPEVTPVPQAGAATPARPGLPPAGDVLVEPLSARELEVLRLIATGMSNEEVGRQLFITSGTVRAHTARIYGKLDVHNRTEAVARARQFGLL